MKWLRDIQGDDLAPHPEDDLSFLVHLAENPLAPDDWIVRHGYNCGDTLCIPGFVGHPKWRPGGEAYRQSVRKGRILARELPQSILGRYFQGRPDDECIPNFPRIEDAVDAFCREEEARSTEFKVTLDRVRDPSCLTIHFRLGDFGICAPRYEEMKRAILRLLPCYTSVVVLTGLHSQTFTPLETTRQITLDGLAFLKDLRKNNIFFCGKNRADESLALMREASHLLVSYGGFSLLGTMITKGQIYATRHILWIHQGDQGARWIEAMTHKPLNLL